MAEHPIQDLMKTAMESIKGMVDANIIIGNTVETPDGTVIIPVSKVSFGFGAGGSDHCAGGAASGVLPFGGGSGAGVTVKPVGFLICAKDGAVRFMPVENNAASDRMMDMVPWVFEKVGQFLDKKNVQENKSRPEEMPAAKDNEAGL